MHKALGTIGGNAMVAFSPFIIPFLGFDQVNDLSRLMTKRQHWERLIDILDDSRLNPVQEHLA